MQRTELYDILSRRARVTLLAAIFFIFAPVALIAISNIGGGWQWTDLAAWMIGSALIAVCWAYSGFTRKSRWLAIAANIAIPMVQALYFSRSMSFGNFGLTIGGVIVVASIAVGYVMFVLFIRGEGRRTVHLMTEMSLAKEIHDHLVPDANYRDSRWEILGRSSASTEVGGDLLDVSRKDEAVVVTVADVSGHGVRAGVMMAMIKSALRTKLLAAGNGSVCDDLNNVVYCLKRPDMYATGVYLELHADRRVRYTGAGHPSLLHINSTTRLCTPYMSQNPPLGVVPGIPFAATDLLLQSGDLLVIVTDGLTEVSNASGEMFGEERIQQFLSENPSKPLEELCADLTKMVQEFGAQEDDQTLVVIRAL